MEAEDRKDEHPLPGGGHTNDAVAQALTATETGEDGGESEENKSKVLADAREEHTDIKDRGDKISTDSSQLMGDEVVIVAQHGEAAERRSDVDGGPTSPCVDGDLETLHMRSSIDLVDWRDDDHDVDESEHTSEASAQDVGGQATQHENTDGGPRERQLTRSAPAMGRRTMTWTRSSGSMSMAAALHDMHEADGDGEHQHQHQHAPLQHAATTTLIGASRLGFDHLVPQHRRPTELEYEEVGLG